MYLDLQDLEGFKTFFQIMYGTTVRATIGDINKRKIIINAIFHLLCETNPGVWDTLAFDLWDFIKFEHALELRGFIWFLVNFSRQYMQNFSNHLVQDKWLQRLAFSTKVPHFGHNWIDSFEIADL